MQYGRIQGGYPGFNFYLPEKKENNNITIRILFMGTL